MLSSPNCNLIVVEIDGFNVWFIVLCFTLPEKYLHGGNGIRQGFVRKKFSCNGAKREELFSSNTECLTLAFRREVITLRGKTRR